MEVLKIANLEPTACFLHYCCMSQIFKFNVLTYYLKQRYPCWDISLCVAKQDYFCTVAHGSKTSICRHTILSSVKYYFHNEKSDNGDVDNAATDVDNYFGKMDQTKYM